MRGLPVIQAAKGDHLLVASSADLQKSSMQCTLWQTTNPTTLSLMASHRQLNVSIEDP